MKKLILFVTISLFFVFGMASSADTHVDKILSEYVKIQTALSQDTTKGVDMAAMAVAKFASAANVEDPEIKQLFSDMEKAAHGLHGKALTEARDQFFVLSKPLLIYLNKHYKGEETYFRYFCGMAQKGWVQNEKPVRNPYHGSEMLTCGELIG